MQFIKKLYQAIKIKFLKFQKSRELIKILPNDIKMLSNFFQLENKKLYLVGGCIRDIFLNKAPKDFDVCTDALPDEVIAILEKYNIKYNLQGEHFAVVVAKMEGGDYEIATFRKDEKVEGDNRHPKVTLGVTIEDDVKRRDITINGLFMDLQTRTIIDLVGGIPDLLNKIIRCIGVPSERFDEDHLRKLRVIRFAARLGFEIHEETWMRIYLKPELNISGERIVNELTVAWNTAKDQDELIYLLYSTRLLYEIFNKFSIKDLPDIDLKRITSLTTFIAAILNEFESDVRKKLVEMNFPLRIATGVEFLNCGDSIDETKPLNFLNKRKSTDLTDSEISIYNNETFAINWLINFQPDPKLSETLMSQGITGKELGEKIHKTYQEQFVSAVNMNIKKNGEI